MGKQWCAFFAPVHAVAVVSAVLLQLAPDFSYAAESRLLAQKSSGRRPAANVPVIQNGVVPSSTPSPISAEAAFLALPAFDVEYFGQAPAQVKVGDRVKLKVAGIVSSPTNPSSNPSSALDPESMDLPPGMESLGDQGWEILSSLKEAQDFTYTVVPLKPGKSTLPALVIKDKAGKQIARTSPFNVEVVSSIDPSDPNPTQPVEVKPPVSLRFPWWVIILVSVLGLALLAGGIYALYRYSKRIRPGGRKGDQREAVVIPRPEDEVALSALAELERLGLMLRGQYKKHYFTISETLKHYIGDRYRFDAAEMTSGEILKVLVERKLIIQISDETLLNFKNLFEHLDLIKFTDVVPQTDQGQHSLETARRLVMLTRRVPVVAPSLTPGSISKGPGNAV